MGTHPTASITWAQALGWRMERHLLDPVGSESVADVVRRLGAVLSMDESLAELAVRTRRTTSRPGELAKALADGEVIKAFAFRGSMHYLSPEDGGVYLALRAAGRQWELPSWVEYYQLRPADWPDFRAAVRDALRDGPLTVRRAGRGADETSRLPAPEAGLRRRRGHADQAADLAGRHELRAAPRRTAHVPAPRRQPAVEGHPRPRRRRSARDHDVPPDLRTGHVRPHPLLARRRPERRPQAARPLALRAGRPAGRGRRRGHHGVRRGRGRRVPRPPRAPRTPCASSPATTSG